MCNQLRMVPAQELNIEDFDNVDLPESYDDHGQLPSQQPKQQLTSILTTKLLRAQQEQKE